MHLTGSLSRGVEAIGTHADLRGAQLTAAQLLRVTVMIKLLLLLLESLSTKPTSESTEERTNVFFREVLSCDSRCSQRAKEERVASDTQDIFSFNEIYLEKYWSMSFLAQDVFEDVCPSAVVRDKTVCPGSKRPQEFISWGSSGIKVTSLLFQLDLHQSGFQW